MAAPFGYGAWLFLKNNPAAQWALGIGLLILIFLFWLSRHDAKVRQMQELRTYRKREKERIRAEAEIETIKEEASHEADEAIAAGHDAGRSSVLSDAALARTLGRTRSSTRSG